MYRKNSLEELYDCLKKFHLSDALYVIGAVNAALKYGTVKTDDKNIPVWIKKWLRLRGIDDRDRRSIAIMLTRMARYILLSGANDHKGIFLDLNTAAFNKAYNLVRDLHDTDVEGEDIAMNFALFFGRTAQWQFPLQASRKNVIGRGYLLFIELMSTIKTDYDFDQKFRGYFNLSLREFFSTGYAMWLISNGTLDYNINVEVAALKGVVTADTQRLFLKLSSGSAKDYRLAIRGDDWKRMDKLKEIYGLDPFVKIPAIAVERSERLSATTYVIPQAKYFLDRASSGIFYLLGDREMQVAHPKGNPFRIAFGKVYRAYVGRHLAQANKEVLVDLDDDFPYTWTKMLPDFALIDGPLCMLLEVKTTLLNIDSRTYQDPAALRIEATGGSLAKAVTQLNTFRQTILDGQLPDPRFSGITRVINVIAGYEDIYSLNNSVLPLLEELHGGAAVDLQLASISDIDAIGMAISSGEQLVKKLQEKIDDKGKHTWGIATLWNELEDKSNPVLDNAFADFNKQLLNEVSDGA
jgi:hypothetical protein